MQKKLTVVPMGNANLPFPREYHHTSTLDVGEDGLPYNWQMGVEFHKAMTLAFAHPNYANICNPRDGFHYYVKIEDV